MARLIVVVLLHVSILIWTGTTCMARDLPLENRAQQPSESRDVRNSLTIDVVLARLEALELQVQAHETLKAQLVQLEKKVQQQESLIAALQKTERSSSGYRKSVPSSVEKLVPDLTPSAVTGMPKSCADLRYMGHTANGLYLTLGTEQIETVFCDFTQLPSDPSFQTWIGFSDIKSLPIYFYFQRSTYFSTPNVIIPFEIEVLNIGGAMSKSGIFTAPRTGKYFFSFIGLPTWPASTGETTLDVKLVLNGIAIGSGTSEDSNTVAYQSNEISLQSTLSLKAGDRVWVEIGGITTGAFLYEDNRHHNHFTGWLLEEDIVESLSLK